MLTTMDAAGRIVVPKPMREALGITDRTELEVTVDDGRIVISPIPVAKHLEQDSESGKQEPAAPRAKRRRSHPESRMPNPES